MKFNILFVSVFLLCANVPYWVNAQYEDEYDDDPGVNSNAEQINGDEKRVRADNSTETDLPSTVVPPTSPDSPAPSEVPTTTNAPAPSDDTPVPTDSASTEPGRETTPGNETTLTTGRETSISTETETHPSIVTTPNTGEPSESSITTINSTESTESPTNATDATESTETSGSAPTEIPTTTSTTISSTQTSTTTTTPASTEEPIIPDEPKDSSISTWAIVLITVFLSFAAFFTFMYFLRKYLLRKRRADRQRLLGRSQEGFFMGGEFGSDQAL